MTGAPDRVLVVVAACILTLCALAALLAIYAVILRAVRERRARRRIRLEQEWGPILIGVLSGARPPFDVWEKVRPSDRVLFIDLLLRFAAGRIGEDRRLLVETAGGFLSHIAGRLRKVDPERYARSIHTLGLLDPDRFAPQIVEALGDPSPLVTLVAARALLRTGRLDHIEAVLEQAESFMQWSPGFLAAMLASAGPAAVPPLRRILSDPAVPAWLRAASADALRETGDLDSADIAAEVLLTARDRELVTAALRLLGRAGRGAHAAVLRALCDSPDFAIRAHAVTALASPGFGGEPGEFRRHLDDPSSWVAIHAAWALKIRGGERILREIASSSHPRACVALQALRERPSS